MIRLRLCRDEVERNGRMHTEQFCSDGGPAGALAVRYGRVLCVRVCAAGAQRAQSAGLVGAAPVATRHRVGIAEPNRCVRLSFACPKSPSRPRVLSPPNLKNRRSPTRSPTKTRSSRHREIRRKTGRCATRSSRMRTGHVPEGGGPGPAAGLSRQSVFSPGSDPKGSIEQAVPMGCKIVRWVNFHHARARGAASSGLSVVRIDLACHAPTAHPDDGHLPLQNID